MNFPNTTRAINLLYNGIPNDISKCNPRMTYSIKRKTRFKDRFHSIQSQHTALITQTSALTLNYCQWTFQKLVCNLHWPLQLQQHQYLDRTWFHIINMLLSGRSGSWCLWLRIWNQRPCQDIIECHNHSRDVQYVSVIYSQPHRHSIWQLLWTGQMASAASNYSEQLLCQWCPICLLIYSHLHREQSHTGNNT